MRVSALVRAVLVGAFLIVGVAPVLAQSIIDQAARQANEIERQNSAIEAEQRLGTIRRVLRAPSGERSEAPAPASSAPDAPCLKIGNITVTGAKILPEAELQKTISKWERKCLGLTDINNVLEAVTYLYMSRGFITARAYVPEQDLSSGSLLITVVEGRLEDIRSSGAASDVGQLKTAFPGMTGKPVNLRDIEQGLDQINRLRSQNAQIELKAGKLQGDSILGVTIAKTKPWWMSVSTNNYGVDATGRTQSRIDLGADNVLGLNDEWVVGYQRSMRGGPLNFSDKRPHGNGYNGSVSIPFGYWLFGLDGSWSNYRTKLKAVLGDVETSGHANSLSVYATRVLHRNQLSKTWATGRLTRKGTENFLLGNRIDANSRVLAIVTTELGHSRRLGGGELTALIGFHQGIKAFNAVNDDVKSAQGNPKAQFSKLTGSLSYGRHFRLGKLNMKLRSTLAGQWSNDVLFGSEQLALGGHSTVRGSRESLLFGNSGVYWRNELSVPLSPLKNPQIASVLGRLEPYAAIDFGHVFGRDNKNAQSGSVVGAALGVRTTGGKLKFDFSYANVIAASLGPSVSRPSGGVVQARLSISF